MRDKKIFVIVKSGGVWVVGGTKIYKNISRSSRYRIENLTYLEKYRTSIVYLSHTETTLVIARKNHEESY